MNQSHGDFNEPPKMQIAEMAADHTRVTLHTSEEIHLGFKMFKTSVQVVPHKGPISSNLLIHRKDLWFTYLIAEEPAHSLTEVPRFGSVVEGNFWM